MLRRLGLLAALTACPVSGADAQEIVFPGIRWGAPADSARARLGALGYAQRGATPTGDRAFARADGAQVLVMLRDGRVVGIYLTDPARGAQADARYRVLADSLETVFGAPLDRRPESRRWEAGLASVAVRVASDRESGVRGVITDWTGPGWFDEMRRRGSLGRLGVAPAGFITVSVLDGVALSVDTTSIVPQAEGRLLRGRFRLDYPQPVDHPTGPYDALEYWMQFDCARALARTLERSPFLGGVRGPSSSGQIDAYPGTDAWRGLFAVCRLGGRGAAVAAHHPVFGAVPTGWVVAGERSGMRWLVDSALVRVKSPGVYEAVIRAQAAEVRDLPGGERMDAVRMRVEADCGGVRWRVTEMTAMLGVNDVSPVPVPREQAAWMDGDANPVVETVCRIAQRRP